MTTLEDARKVLDTYLQTDGTDRAAILENTKKTIEAYTRFAHDAIFGAVCRAAEAVFLVIGALVAARGVHDTLDDVEIDFVNNIIDTTVVVVTERKMPQE